MILILSNKWDITVDFVVRELQEREHPYLRVNTEELPDIEVTSQLPDLSVIIEQNDERVDIAKEIGAIWYRRPGEPYEFAEDQEKPDKSTVEYITEQWGAWIQSLRTISGITWVNSPDANHQMESKIYQLSLAHEIGFTIPETTITNRKEDAVEAFNRHGQTVITKALSSPLITKTEQNEFVFSVLLEEPPKDAESLSICPTIFQEPLVPKTDYRVTVVGDQVLPVKIEAEKGKHVPVDWRKEKESLRFVQTELPVEIEELCREFVREADLLFGAIDLVRANGEYVFLEINPNGEWGWLQKPWGVPIAENITDLLIEQDCKGGQA